MGLSSCIKQIPTERLSLKRGFGGCGYRFGGCDGLSGLDGFNGLCRFGGFNGLGGFGGFSGFSRLGGFGAFVF